MAAVAVLGEICGPELGKSLEEYGKELGAVVEEIVEKLNAIVKYRKIS